MAKVLPEIENPMILDRPPYRSPETVYPIIVADPMCCCGCGETVDIEGWAGVGEYFSSDACIAKVAKEEWSLNKVGWYGPHSIGSFGRLDGAYAQNQNQNQNQNRRNNGMKSYLVQRVKIKPVMLFNVLWTFPNGSTARRKARDWKITWKRKKMLNNTSLQIFGGTLKTTYQTRHRESDRKKKVRIRPQAIESTEDA
jgi:hypothetical protein